MENPKKGKKLSSRKMTARLGTYGVHIMDPLVKK